MMLIDSKVYSVAVTMLYQGCVDAAIDVLIALCQDAELDRILSRSDVYCMVVEIRRAAGNAAALEFLACVDDLVKALV